MTAIKSFWRKQEKSEEAVEAEMETAVLSTVETAVTTPAPSEAQTFDLDIAPNDPFLAYCLNSKGIIDVEKLMLESTAVKAMKQAGVRLVVPLVSQGDLIGLINLGERRSEQEYTSDDFRLLQDLSIQAAPALKVAQLVQQQKLEAAERERIQQELRVARLIQQTLLPQELPKWLVGRWMLITNRPARLAVTFTTLFILQTAVLLSSSPT
ncbi:MAG: GAF domain-containing protein [Anaerolineae bacterium]|nr:GAF domain-containing protein [Anaerolineae bacterium]